MGILKNLLVTGVARFVNTIKGTVEKSQNGIYYGICDTAAATAAKVVTLTDATGFELKPGVMIGVKFSASNSASNVTLNVNGTGAKSIYYNNAVYTSTDTTVTGYADRYMFYLYDGTNWVWISHGQDNNDNTYSSAWCGTAASTAAKAASCSNFALTANTYLHVVIRYANTAASAITLNVNSTGAKPIYINGTASSTSNYTLPAGSYIVFYDGTNWYFRTDGKLPGRIESQNIWYGTCATSASTAAKVVTTTTGDFVLETGSMVRVKFTGADTYDGTSTLNVDETGAVNIIRVGTTAKARYYWQAGEVVDFVYDGESFTMLKGGVATTTYYGMVKLSSATNSTTTSGYAATPAAVKAVYDLAEETSTKVAYGDVGSGQTPVYFDDDLPQPGIFTWGVNSDQNVQVGWDGDAPEIVIPTNTALPVDQGGTGATTAADARTNLGLGSAATYNVVSTVNNDSNLVTGAAIKNYYEAVGIPSAICTTTAATAAKVAICSSYSLLANSYVQVIIEIANTASSALTLNINGKGAKPIYINGVASSATNKTLPAGSYFVFYNGTNYYFRTDGKITGDITGDATTINSHTVAVNVPSDAKFTDTVNTWYGTCETAAGTAAKVVTTTTGNFTLVTGNMVRVKFTNNDTYNGTSTLNVDGSGTKNIMRVGTSAKARYNWSAGEVVDFVFDGVYFTMVEGGVATTTYYGITKLTSSVTSTADNIAATPAAVKTAYDLAAGKEDAFTTLSIEKGGTGANSQLGAINNLRFYVIDASTAGATTQYGQVSVTNPANSTDIVLLTSTFSSGSTIYAIGMETITTSSVTLRVRSVSDGTVLSGGILGKLMIYKVS